MNDVLSLPATKSGSARMRRCSGMVVLMPFDDRHLERALHPRDRFLAVAAVDDDLRDHRVVVRRDRAIGVRERLDADARAARHAEHVDHARRRHERLRILGVDAALDRVAGERDVALLERRAVRRPRSGSAP